MELWCRGVVVWAVLVAWASCSRAPAGSCPPVCVCKWKGGKQTVECVDRGLITVPELVDPASQVLDMAGNNLQTLPREAFERTGLINLQKIYLRNCKLGQIDDRAFKGLSNLVELDLSNNLLTRIPTPTFRDTHFLRDLILSHNPIQKIKNDALETTTNLVKLDLSNCEVREISPDAFHSVQLLESLKLNGNELQELPPHAFNKLTRLRGIELYDNPWTCDCRLRELKVWLTERNVPFTVAPKCFGGPSSVIERTFSELPVDYFACKPEILPVRRYVEAAAGDNATVVCRAGAVPPASVTWYWNGKLLLNNTAFSLYQKLYIFEEGSFEKKSSLVLTNAQEIDSSEFYCVAENKAGNAEANFTLHVASRAVGMATLGSAQIASLGAALFLVIVVILLLVLVLLVRLRGAPVSESKTPGRLESGSTVDSSAIVSSKSCAPPATLDATSPQGRGADARCNPVQKPPRTGEVPYTTDHYEGRGSIVTAAGPVALSPTASGGNNPDLINDTRPGSGEYSREVSDSLYPSGLWEGGIPPRTAGGAPPAYYSDRTPIIDSCSANGSQEELGLTSSYASKTFPRTQHVANGYPPDYGLPMAVGAGTRTLRVWQRAPPVLPPVTALKRALASSRSSPDEGYQEGCGTDV